ncbi:MAG: hypothetical protein ACYTGQ_04820 [Planctomycetota bacterium]|jgi:hypothetical protein
MTTRPENPPGAPLLPDATTASPNPAAQGLTPEQLKEIEEAKRRAKPIRAAAAVAAFNGWTFAVIAFLSALFTLIAMSVISGVVTVILVIVARNEFKGRRALLAFDPRAATLLGRNQIGLLAAIIGYCIVMLYRGLYHPSPEFQELIVVYKEVAPQIDMQTLYEVVVWALYGGVATASLLIQGFNAAYYFKRRGMIQLYRYHTPDWVIELKRAGHVE